MPELAKKSSGNSKAPVVGSPIKHRSSEGATDKKSSKDAVKLPTLTSSTGSPTKKSAKTEPSAIIVPNTSAAAILTPTSPTRPSAKPTKASGKAKSTLAPMLTPTSEQQIESQMNRATVEGSPEKARTDAFPPEEESGPVVADIVPQQTYTAEAEAKAHAEAERVKAEEVTAARAQDEVERLRKVNGNGMIKLIYEQYDELFPIVDGSTTQANVDEVYCLSFVMPNCVVHLSYHPNAERFERENTGIFDSLLPEDPRGTYHDLIKDQTYYVVVEQEADQLRRDQEATKAKWAPAVQQDKLKKDDGRGFESCSCIYGNPCVDEYGCKDWHSRFAVATANGWKGF